LTAVCTRRLEPGNSISTAYALAATLATLSCNAHMARLLVEIPDNVGVQALLLLTSKEENQQGAGVLEAKQNNETREGTRRVGAACSEAKRLLIKDFQAVRSLYPLVQCGWSLRVNRRVICPSHERNFIVESLFLTVKAPSREATRPLSALCTHARACAQVGVYMRVRACACARAWVVLAPSQRQLRLRLSRGVFCADISAYYDACLHCSRDTNVPPCQLPACKPHHVFTRAAAANLCSYCSGLPPVLSGVFHVRAAAATALSFLASHPIGACGDECLTGPHRETLVAQVPTPPPFPRAAVLSACMVPRIPSLCNSGTVY
jgi:hypothetical protein